MATKRDIDRPQSVPPANPLAERLEDKTLKASSSHSRLSQLNLEQRITVGSFTVSPRSRVVSEEGANHVGRHIRASRVKLQNDPEYKRYAQTIERALSTFDSVAEWADFIAFLSRLHRALISTAMPYMEIPHKLQISKRLSQGLNPALPNGVHQRTLEVYRDIFKLLGKDGLERDLPTWSSGLFPCFQYASTAVRPTVLDLYETYYLPLGRSLRPASKALALALLPGLEEETGDHFDRVLRLVDKISESVDDSHFLQSVFAVMMTHPGSRTSAVNYLTKRLPPRLKPMLKSLQDSQTAEHSTASSGPIWSGIIGPDGGLFVRALSSGLQDDNVLVRRGTLDLLNTCLPLPVLLACNDFSPEDRRLLAKSACGIVLRKDLSLSKRLYGWLVGAEDSSEKQMDRFRKYALDLVANSLREDMSDLELNTLEATKPFRIFVSLLDRWEVGYPLSIALVHDAMNIAMSADHSKLRDETVRDNARLAARAVYEAVEPYVFWCIVSNRLEAAIEKRDPAMRSTLRLVIWVLNTFRIQDDEVIRVHLPLLLHFLNRRYSSLMQLQPQLTHELLQVVIAALPWKSLKSKESAQADSEPANYPGQEYYSTSFAYRPPDLQRTDCPSAQALLQGILSNLTASDVAYTSLSAEARLFAIALRAGSDNIGDFKVVWQPQRWLPRMVSELELTDDIGAVAILVDLVCKLSSVGWVQPSLALKQSSLARSMADSSNRLHTHTESLALLWKVADATSPNVIRNAIMNTLSDDQNRAVGLRAFSRLWSLTDAPEQQAQAYGVPLFFVLKSLHSSDVALSRLAQEWMRCDLGLYVKMLDVTCEMLLEAMPSLKSSSTDVDGKNIVFNHIGDTGDLAQTTFILQRLVDILSHGGQALAMHIMISPVPSRWTTLTSLNDRITTFSDLIQQVALDLLLSWRISPTRRLHPSELHLHLAAVAVLATLGQSGSWTPPDLSALVNDMVPRLFVCVRTGDLDAQCAILDLVKGIIIKQGQLGEKSSFQMQPKDMIQASQHLSLNGTNGNLLKEVKPDHGYLLQTALAGISLDSNRTMLADWLDFVLTLSTALSVNTVPILYPISDTICDQIHARLSSDTHQITTSGVGTMSGEGDIPLLLNAAELIIRRILPGDGSISTPIPMTPSSEPAGLFGYVSTVLSGDASHSRAVKVTPAGGILRILQGVIGAALATYETYFPKTPSLAISSNPLLTATEDCLKQLFRWRSFDTLNGIVECSIQDDLFRVDSGCILRLLDSLESNSHKLVQILCDMLTTIFVEEPRNLQSSHYSSPSKTLKMLDLYISTMETPVAIDVLPLLLSLVRVAVTPSSSRGRQYVLGLLSSYFGVLEKIARTSAFNDRRLRKDALDCLSRLLEAALNAAPIGNKQNPAHRPASFREGENDNDASQLGSTFLFQFLNSKFLPGLQEVVQQDDERISQMTGMVANMLVGTNQKHKPRTANDVSYETLQTMERLAHFPQAVKIWRPFVQDMFNDASLFTLKQGNARKSWMALMASMLSSDKDRFVDLLDRSLAVTSAANLFISREQETVQRAAVIRRISLSLFVCPKNQYLAQLPLVQTRVVELLRTHIANSSILSEVYLLLRVTLCRFGEQHLSGMLSIIVSETARGFESMLDSLPPDDVSGLRIALAVCKLLDLMLTLGMDEFQMHQWLFVTDTTDVLYPDQIGTPETLVDQLSEAISVKFRPHFLAPATAAPTSPSAHTSRRPELAQMKLIDSLVKLQPFLLNSGIKSFEEMYRGTAVDWNYIDDAMEDELFDV